MGRIILMALMVLATVAGCNRFPDLSIQIVDDLAPEPPECTVTTEQEEIVLRGRWDLDYIDPITNQPPAYNMILRIESYIVDTSLLTQAPQGNMNITSYDVLIKLPDDSVVDFGPLPNPYNIRTNAVIPPSQTFEEISRGIGFAAIIPSDYRGAIRGLINASGFNSIVLEIQANGTTAGGFSQQSPPFSWPVEICFGCLGVECPVGTVLPSCFPGQDISPYCDSFLPPPT